jgi:hypothetical protein
MSVRKATIERKVNQGNLQVLSTMLKHDAIAASKLLLLSGILGSVLASAVPAQSPANRSSQSEVAGAPSRYRPNRFPRRERDFYQLMWGVDSFSVKAAESGEIIRFSYRVLDANKAKALNDKRAEPFLLDPQAQVKLVIPSLENVGLLRQTAPPEPGRSYWMVFSNKGRLVKPGDRVSVEIGSFRVDGLVVE